jgi:sialate O-acetylesterase
MLAICASLTLASGSLADVKLPAIFTDNLVLQRDVPAPIWGWAASDEKVTVTLGPQTKTATPGSPSGKWMVKLDAMKAGGPYTLTVAGNNTITLKNVLIGEVWVCSGQSNMAMSVKGVNNAAEEIAAAKHPKIRLISVPARGSQTPLEDFQGKWVECSPATVGGFSAAGYFFGRELHQALGVPIGLINTSYGGSSCEAWVKRSVLQSDPQYKPMLDRYEQMISAYDPAKAKAAFEKQRAARKLAVEKAKAAGKKAPNPPRLQGDPRSGNQVAANLYNGMLTPVLPYGMRGAIWYQGESNAGRAYQYRNLFPTMIENWRADWQQGDFPFYFVQLANFMAVKPEPTESAWAELREAQSMTLKLPNTGQAVIIDIGEAADIHPKNKQDVGKRLALWALAKTYDQDVVCSGPTYKSMEKKGDQIVLHFDHIGGGLLDKGGEGLKGFAVAGDDKKFVWADAKIVGDTVVVGSPKVAAPAAVRYAWADNPVCNLYNKAGLPACPFRTDDWRGTTADKH